MTLVDERGSLMPYARLGRTVLRSRYPGRLMSRGAMAVCLVVTTVLAGAPATASLPAFPGAEGAGALAIGGRGGEVCKVTNLNDSGAGSLRDCVERRGPRTVVFDVGGTIELSQQITIREPYITIAGQTAPGGGIQIKAGKDWAGGGKDLLLIYNTHDVVVRYLRLRKGYTGHKDGNIRVRDASENVIVDHVSLFWAENQNWTVYANAEGVGPRNITLQNSIVTEMMDDRVNSLLAAEHNSSLEKMEDLDHHNNLFSTSRHRNPLGRYASGRWVNNIVYNWGAWASRHAGGGAVDWISNLWRPGPETWSDERGMHGLQFIPYYDGSNRINRDPSMYVEGNRDFASGMSPETNNWPYTRKAVGHDNSSDIEPTPLEWRRNDRLPVAGVPITIRHVDELENYLLPIVGASRRLDCNGNWVENRDATDSRVIKEYLNRQGTRAKSGQGEEIYGGHPYIASGVPCLDTSGDGVPDEWAIANGLDFSDPSLGAKVHDSGYTYLELYLNGNRLSLAAPARIPQITVE